MKDLQDIGKDSFADKLRNFRAEPPENAWDEISAELHPGGNRKKVFLIIAVAASMALAITVGLNILGPDAPISGEPAVSETLMEDPSEQAVVDAQSDVNVTPREVDQPAPASVNQPAPASANAQGNQNQQAGREVVLAANQEHKPSRLEEKVRTAIDEAAPALVEAITEESVITADAAPVFTEPEEQSIEEIIDESHKISSLEELNEIAGDQEQIEEAEVNRWQLGAAFSPQYTYRDASSPDITQNRVVNSSESGMIAYAGGVRVSYLPTSRLVVESGVYYNKMGLNIGSYQSYWARLNADYDFIPVDNRNVVTLANSIGNIMPKGDELYYNKYTMQEERAAFSEIQPAVMTYNGERITTITQTFSYLEIPLNLRYKVLDRRFDLQIIGGVSTNLLVDNSVIGNTDSESVKIGSVHDVRTMNYAGNAGIGFVYDIFEHLIFSIEPRFRYYLNSVNNPLLPSTRPYSFGLYTGLNYSF